MTVTTGSMVNPYDNELDVKCNYLVFKFYIKTTYHCLIHSIISFAILLWGHPSSSAHGFSLQRKTIRLISGLRCIDDCRTSFTFKYFYCPFYLHIPVSPFL